MPLKRPPYVEGLLELDPSDTASMAEFFAKYHPTVRAAVEGGKSPQEALRSVRRRKSVNAAVDDAEELRLRMAEIMDEHEPLPRGGEIRERRRQPATSSGPSTRGKTTRSPTAGRCGPAWCRSTLPRRRSTGGRADRQGFPGLGHQVRSGSKAAKNGWRLRAVLELIEANALNRTDSQIGRHRSKKEARELAEVIFDRLRGHRKADRA